MGVPSLFDPPATAEKPRLVGCKACCDLGTMLVAGFERESRTVPEMMQCEIPCICCEAGALMRKLFEEFSTPLVGGKAA